MRPKRRQAVDEFSCETQDEVDYYWEPLSEGGKEGRCGWPKDRYGLSRQVVPTGMEDVFADPDPKRGGARDGGDGRDRRLDIAALRSAADGVAASRAGGGGSRARLAKVRP